MTRRWSGHRRATRLRPNDRACPRRIGEVPEETKIMQEEPFVPIAPFENFYELIMRANSLPYGLAGYAFTRSLATATRASEALEVGMGGVNDLLLATAEMPFGGVSPSFSTRGVCDPRKRSRTTSWSKGLYYSGDVLILI